MKLLLAVLLSVSASAQVIRIECGLDGRPNPHNTNVPYIAVYQYDEMPAPKMLFFHWEQFHQEEELDLTESLFDSSEWPKLTAVMRYDDNGTEKVTRMTIDSVQNLYEHMNYDHMFEFEASGHLVSDVLPGQTFALECYGLFRR